MSSKTFGEARKELANLLDERLVLPRSISLGSFVLSVTKKDWTFGMCVDYGGLKKYTVENHFFSFSH